MFSEVAKERMTLAVQRVDLSRSCLPRRHQRTYQATEDDEIADGDAKALDRYGEIESDGRLRVGELREGEEGGLSMRCSLSAIGEKIEAERRHGTGEEDGEDAGRDTACCDGVRHGEGAYDQLSRLARNSLKRQQTHLYRV